MVKDEFAQAKVLKYLRVTCSINIFNMVDSLELDGDKLKCLLDRKDIWDIQNSIKYTKLVCEELKIKEWVGFLRYFLYLELKYDNPILSKTIYMTLRYDVGENHMLSNIKLMLKKLLLGLSCFIDSFSYEVLEENSLGIDITDKLQKFWIEVLRRESYILEKHLGKSYTRLMKDKENVYVFKDGLYKLDKDRKIIILKDELKYQRFNYRWSEINDYVKVQECEVVI